MWFTGQGWGCWKTGGVSCVGVSSVVVICQGRVVGDGGEVHWRVGGMVTKVWEVVWVEKVTELGRECGELVRDGVGVEWG